MANALLAAGTPAYMAVCRKISEISSARETVAEGRSDVHADLVFGPQRHQCSEGDDAPRAAVRAGPRPGSAPCVAGYELLERSPEIARRSGGAIDVLVAQNLASGAACRCRSRSSRCSSLDQLGGARGLLHAGEVGGARYDVELGTGDALGDRVPVVGWRGRIVSTGEDQGGGADQTEIAPEVHAGDGFAAARVPLGGRGHERAAEARHRPRGRSPA